MIHVSEEFKEQMGQRRDFRCHAQVTLASGETLELGGDEFTISGNSLTDGAGANALPLGAAVCRTVRLSMINDDGSLDQYDFFGAVIRLWLVFPLSQTQERIELGSFTVLDPASWGETVAITGCDGMYQADRPYETDLDFPASLGSMFREICDRCHIPYATAAFPNEGFLVTAAPEGELTCRQVLGYIAMLAGGNARIGRMGEMSIIPYELNREPEMTLEDFDQLQVGTDDIIVTGVAATVRRTDDSGQSTQQTVLSGEEGYVLTVENPLMAGQEERALALIGGGILGYPFRQFEGRHAAFPMGEFMDMVRLTDRRGRSYVSVLTDIDFTFGGFTTFANSAQGTVRNGSRYMSAEAKARLAARELVQRERTDREAAVEQLARRLAESGGLYTTQQQLEDGSVICYVHDRPTLEASGSVMKLTGDAIGFSTDGGESWPFGITVTGEIIMGIIQSEGLSADWVKFGTLPRDRVDGLEDLAASFQVMKEQVTIDIARAAQELQAENDELRARYNELTKYYRFTGNGLLIGDSASDLTLRLDNGRLSFLDRGAEVAYISDRKMYITDGHFLNSLRIGSFAFIPRTNGNLSFIKVD